MKTMWIVYIHQSQVGWCKRHAPYLNSSEAAQTSLGTQLTQEDQLTQANSAILQQLSQSLDSTKAVLLQHTTLGRVEFSFSVIS